MIGREVSALLTHVIALLFRCIAVSTFGRKGFFKPFRLRNSRYYIRFFQWHQLVSSGKARLNEWFQFNTFFLYIFYLILCPVPFLSPLLLSPSFSLRYLIEFCGFLHDDICRLFTLFVYHGSNLTWTRDRWIKNAVHIKNACWFSLAFHLTHST